jgi:murein DD-endopeptidase MepM/ murein hydrolase activator NlpD
MVHKMKFICLFLVATLALMSSTLASLVWPTPNTAFRDGKSIEAFIQSTASGNIESGLFGCVRNEGQRFHEAIDLSPIRRDAAGEATDPIFSILAGKVAYINNVSSQSSYGRYIIIQHNEEALPFHSLYAHMAQIDSSLKVGHAVKKGMVLGVMGRSAGGYHIPKTRAHLHFEVGLKLSDDFQVWYDRQQIKTKNHHGNWNGMNLVSVDPLAFFRAVQVGDVEDFNEFIKKRPVVANLRIFTNKVPDFIKRYPALVVGSYDREKLVAWDIAFTDFGLPMQWTPQFTKNKIKIQEGTVSILSYAPDRLRRQSCNRVLEIKEGRATLSSQTLATVQKLFGFK